MSRFLFTALGLAVLAGFGIVFLLLTGCEP